MDPASFRRHGHELVDWIADYLEHPERHSVLSRNKPGDIAAALPSRAPEEAESFGAVMADVERVLVPGLTHWNHPGFFAYFAITASPPGILAEFLSAALNQQAMLWRTSPAATELEQVSLGWLRQLIGLPEAFDGVIYDTASVSTLHALAAARQAGVPHVRTRGLTDGDRPRYRIYCSTQAHSSVDKAVIALGLGQESLRRIATDAEFRMDARALAEAVAADRARGDAPLAVVATIGTTSTTSADPLPAIAGICEAECLWLHVDAAYAGAAAMLPTHRHYFTAAERADSFVINPHKWLFVPFDLSALYCRRMDVLRAAFSLTPEYLQTTGTSEARNLMDVGIPLGRRFRALKLWMTMRTLGATGLRERLAEHVRLAQVFAGWVDADADFVRVAPAPFSVVCFRWEPVDRAATVQQVDALNAELLDRVNQSGEVFISHTVLDRRYVLRLAIGHERTTIAHVTRAWEIIVARARELRESGR